jgi:hypothetical protein
LKKAKYIEDTNTPCHDANVFQNAPAPQKMSHSIKEKCDTGFPSKENNNVDD